MSTLSSDLIRKRKITFLPDARGSANCAYDERASIQANRDQPLCRKIRSILCLTSERLLMKNNSKCFKCVYILEEGDDRVTIEFANCQIERRLC